MSKQKLVLLGGGGHCRSCIDVIETEKKYDIVGILDVPDKVGSQILSYEVIGTDSDINQYVKQGCHFLITVGHIGNAGLREKLSTILMELNAAVATIVSPRAYVSKHAKLGEGTIVMHDALVNANAVIGKHCIVNTKALIEHDAIVADHVHISTAAVINGGVRVGVGSFVGSNAVTKQEAIIQAKSFIKAGAVFK